MYALMKFHAIPHTSFETTRSWFIQILQQFSVVKDKSSVLFLAEISILWIKSNFQNSSVKIHQIPYVMFETNNQFFFKLCIIL